MHILVEWSLGGTFLVSREINVRPALEPQTTLSAVKHATTGPTHFTFKYFFLNVHYVHGSLLFEVCIQTDDVTEIIWRKILYEDF